MNHKLGGDLSCQESPVPIRIHRLSRGYCRDTAESRLRHPEDIKTIEKSKINAPRGVRSIPTVGNDI